MITRMKKSQFYAFCLMTMLFGGAFCPSISAQMITGVWKGKINRQKVEVKIIQQGDSLTGTSYYYESANNYRRYSIRGFFDANSNEAVWWDDQLLEEKSGRFSISIPGKVPLLSRADFNCPGGSRMMLDGKAARKENETDIRGDVHLDKISQTEFEDEWDFVIENYTVGANDRDIIDSVANIAFKPVMAEEKSIALQTEEKPETKTITPQVVSPAPEKIVEKPAAPIEQPKPIEKPVLIIEKPKPIEAAAIPVKVPTIEDKFKTRQKVFIKEIPVTGDSIELRFYDNAEIDGDSISIFLNDKLLFSHIRLTGNAYSIRLAVSELNATNELIMVAENLGAIPPNTSYLVALVEGKRYDAFLASTEGSSAMIRLIKNVP
jgi:hypothetical protein